jgi:uncharacterized SAM-binding protein YcdF (DUF218 family)
VILLVRPALRWSLRLAIALLAAVILYLVVTAIQVYQASTRNQAAQSQAIIVLGAAQYNGRPSPDLAARLAHAYALWHQGYAPLVAVTGGRRPGDVYTEADAGQMFLEARGVPSREILASGVGNNTWESLAAVAVDLKARDIRRVLLVSDPFHDARIAAVASALGLQGLVSPTRQSPIKGAATIPYFTKETVAVALGRIIGFQRLSNISSGLALVRPGL